MSSEMKELLFSLLLTSPVWAVFIGAASLMIKDRKNRIRVSAVEMDRCVERMRAIQIPKTVRQLVKPMGRLTRCIDV